jgi:hypothetical protein
MHISEYIVNEWGTEWIKFRMWNMGKKHKSGFYTRVCKQSENEQKNNHIGIKMKMCIGWWRRWASERERENESVVCG